LTTNIFISYAREDQALKDELLVHLEALERSGSITVVHDLDIPPGSDWDQEIRRELESCGIALLLVSKNFLASDYIQEIELPILKHRREEGSARLVPIILGPCVWEPSLGDVAALPVSGTPVTMFTKGPGGRDTAWREIALAIQELISSPDPHTAPARRPRPSNGDASPASAGDAGPRTTNDHHLKDPEQAAALLLALPSPGAAQGLDDILRRCPGGSAGRRRCLAELVGRALRTETYVPALLARCFSDLSAGHASSLSRRIQRSLRDGSARILGPSLLNPKVEAFLASALIECARTKVSCIIVSCIGMSDNLNLETHVQTLAVSSLEVYLNSPNLLIGIGERDEQLESPDTVKDDYMLARGDGETRVDVLRKLTRLFSSLYRLAQFREQLQESGLADGRVVVNFLHDKRPPFTGRVLREAGHFVLFPDSIPLPRPLVRFAIVGRDVELAESLVLASRRLVPAEQEPWVPTRAGLADMIEASITTLAVELKQLGYSPRDFEVLQPVLGVRSRGEGWIARRILTGMSERM
jgi:hypothetical protein